MKYFKLMINNDFEFRNLIFLKFDLGFWDLSMIHEPSQSHILTSHSLQSLHSHDLMQPQPTRHWLQSESMSLVANKLVNITVPSRHHHWLAPETSSKQAMPLDTVFLTSLLDLSVGFIDYFQNHNQLFDWSTLKLPICDWI